MTALVLVTHPDALPTDVAAARRGRCGGDALTTPHRG
jgi:hypothetical protein